MKAVTGGCTKRIRTTGALCELQMEGLTLGKVWETWQSSRELLEEILDCFKSTVREVQGLANGGLANGGLARKAPIGPKRSLSGQFLLLPRGCGVRRKDFPLIFSENLGGLSPRL